MAAAGRVPGVALATRLPRRRVPRCPPCRRLSHPLPLRSQEPSSASSKKRPPLRRGKISPQLPVPEHIPRPSYVGSNRPQELSSVRQIHSAEGIAGMRAACKLAARALDFAGTLIKPSVTTNEIDREVHNMIIEAGAYPSQLGYGGFPKSICTSLNECVCHGVPDSTQLQTGDIMNVDVNVFLNGYHGGASRTFVCGEVDDSIRHFLKAAEECLEKGITVCRDGVNYKKIGKKISKLAYFYGYYVVDRFVGHGIGPIWHSEPLILHHANDNSGRMVEGQTFTIEPILTMEKAETVTWEDGWTTVTADGSWAAQFKHTVHMWQDYRSQAEELIDEICDESSVPGEWLVRRVCGSLEFYESRRPAAALPLSRSISGEEYEDLMPVMTGWLGDLASGTITVESPAVAGPVLLGCRHHRARPSQSQFKKPKTTFRREIMGELLVMSWDCRCGCFRRPPAVAAEVVLLLDRRPRRCFFPFSPGVRVGAMSSPEIQKLADEVCSAAAQSVPSVCYCSASFVDLRHIWYGYELEYWTIGERRRAIASLQRSA
ncbi:hypothetical protein OsI_26154 [Oryza sativa Indica Group]|uniref:Methionine aminopeptidase n=1 Tax=Oryza sativa subsp. indica TaxID=39946 RepID=B8B6P4_ORYSI|nr:hypothetical protein OsI_26154 [Oryza sativa Indica Group]